eukprot:SAG11_NODE_10488_length_828_cov_0.973937_1_plen_117_part_10
MDAACRLKFLLLVLVTAITVIVAWLLLLLLQGVDQCGDPIVKQATNQETPLTFHSDSGLSSTEQCKWLLTCATGVTFRLTTLTNTPLGSLTVYDGGTVEGPVIYGENFDSHEMLSTG